MARLKFGALTVVLTLIFISLWGGGCASGPGGGAGQNQPYKVACRLANYGPDNEDAGLQHIRDLGLHYVFMSIPKPEEVEATQQKLKDLGLELLVVRGDTDLSKDTSVDELRVQFETCKRLGVQYMFLSPKRHDAPFEVIYDRLRRAGDFAAANGVTLVLETHPDLGTNGDVHMATMKAINHPNVRVNFDTANITYYNHDTSAAAELEKCLDYVATVEVKDHNGQFETWDFPALGEGVVDFPAVFKLLKKHGYAGPVTIEVEGVKGIDWTLEDRQKALEDSVAYLRSIGVLKAGLRYPDYFMIIGYFVLMLAIGLYFYRSMRGIKEYFSGGNKIPWWLSGVSFYMSSFSAAAFIFYPSLCYRYGFVGVTLLWVAVPATLFSTFFLAKKWRRARIESPMEYLEIRYSPVLRQLFSWQGVPTKIIDDGIKLFAIGIFVSGSMGFDQTWCMIGGGLIMLLYTFMGGLWAVAVTDFVQFVVLTAAIIIILPLSFFQAGGVENVFSRLPDNFMNLTSPEYGWGYVLFLVVMYTLAWSSVNWSLIQRYYCVPKERDAVKVGLSVVFLYVIGPPLMFLPAIAGTQLLPGLEDAGTIYPALCRLLLPAGMMGLMISAMFAATMSMLSGDYNVCANVLTHDIYRRLIRPDASQRELVFVGRLTTIIVGLLALGAALLMARGKGEDLFRIMVTLFGVATAPVAIPMILGLLSRRFTATSSLWGFVFGLTVGISLFVLSLYGKPLEFLIFRWIPETSEIAIGAYAAKMEMVLFVCTSLVTLTVMLLITLFRPMKKEESEHVTEFFNRLDMPIGSLEHEKEDGGHSVSPFRIVGISLIIIALMMIVVLPWSGTWITAALNGGISIFLIVVGAVMTRLDKGRTTAA